MHADGQNYRVWTAPVQPLGLLRLCTVGIVKIEGNAL
jgi:hypothetical protein